MRAISMVLFFLILAFALHFAFGDNLTTAPITIFNDLLSGDWEGISLWQAIIAGCWVGSGVGIIAGTILNRDIYIYSGVAIAMGTWIAPVIEVYKRAKEYGVFGGDTFVITFIASAFVLVWIFLLVEFVRGRDD